ncbi:hypothetical protein BCY86_01200 [Pajaroellobacter abortibovis]|uniref:Uncharacterized protein n=1 Tax=Pajaroellobacter abortibovis TaxID=1882918 RepID=A0A1L6MVA9_9BACT|nr:hypothetical protein BCY86_01200 [Pajaroellobacter abortibovis]
MLPLYLSASYAEPLCGTFGKRLACRSTEDLTLDSERSCFVAVFGGCVVMILSLGGFEKASPLFLHPFH